MKVDDVKKIAVIGAGDMGNGIAEVAILAGYEVAMRDIEQRFVDRGVDTIKKSLAKLVQKNKITEDASNGALARLRPLVDLEEAVKDADFIIEAVPEIMDLKKSVFKDLDRLSPKHAILATNTSNMSITEIASATNREDKVVGMHFFNPAILMKLVEVIKGEKTSDETVHITYDISEKFGKVPVIVKKDSPGFIYNRVNAPTSLLISKIMDAGSPTPEEFDAAFKAIMPMTPFELADYVGLDVAYHSLKYFSEVLSPEYKPSKVLEEKVNAKELGKKTGKGFYDWSSGRPNIDTSKATKEFDINHLIALQVNEATKLLEEGVVDDPKVIDLAMANGGGAGIGPFTLAKSIGYETLVKKCEELADKFKVEVFRPTKTMREGKISV
ncbi:MAG: 3-hydroxyacyl-CoA dehydrogenase family protein [Deltaproteobacteria bacterium]|nr:3-hydroxyacyl-CoA dehydrogenase family protein [Deltaproteobacteria bacterium]